MDDDKTHSTLVRLVRELRATQARAYEQLEAIDRLLARDLSIADQVRNLLDTWAGLWGALYQDRYAFAAGKDAGNLRRLLKSFAAEDIVARMRTYLANNEGFYIKSRHSLGIFVASINSHGPQQAPGRITIGRGHSWECLDDPPCEPGTTEHECHKRHGILEEKRSARSREALT